MRALKSASLLVVPLLAFFVPIASSAPAASARTASTGLSYVAMGSSFAAGPGIDPTEPGSAASCGRSAENYANLLAQRLGAALTDVSCLGATTANILTTDQNGQPPQIEATGPSTRLVTVTIGGNDIDYFGSLAAYSCQDGGGHGCHAVNVPAIDRSLRVLIKRLENVVHAVHTRSPRARVLLVNYFTVLPARGTCAGVPLSPRHQAFERNLALDLATDTAVAARATGATLVDLAGASAQHDACSADPWVNTFYPAAGRWAYHPTVAGMAGAASLIEKVLRTSGDSLYGGENKGDALDALGAPNPISIL